MGYSGEERPSLFDAKPTDRVYTVRFDNDGNAYLIFGDGKKGSRLTSGIENVIARYRSGIGIDGEVASELLTLLPSRPVGIKKVINPEQASGSEDPKSLMRQEGMPLQPP